MAGESDWITFYGQLVEFVTKSPLQFDKIMLRVLDPTIGLVSNTPETQNDLWTVSTSSVFYTALISQLPATVKTFDVYPYLMDAANQRAWMASMGTSTPLEGVFKYCQSWNNLLSEIPSSPSIRCGGVTVDGEERRGYVNEIALAPTYKSQYQVGFFGYATGYTQVGVISQYAGYVDGFYFEMYDFYRANFATVELVQNSDVPLDDAASFIALLDDQVWARYLPFYESARANFMWSLQNSAGGDCLYPLGPSYCGAKEDFGVWSLNGFRTFLSRLKEMYPTKFGNKPHGLFQFSLTPFSWFASPS